MDVVQALDQAIIDSFADMAFMDASPVADDIGTLESIPTGQLVHISFGRPLSGFLTLHLGAIAKQRLVENIYGQGWDELAGSQVDDCLMELANIVAGNFLLAFGMGEDRHSVSLPQVLYDEDEIPEWATPLTRFYRVDDSLIQVFLAYKIENQG